MAHPAQHGKQNTTIFPQTVESMKSFNDGVFDFIQSTPELDEHMTYMDVFSASLTWPYQSLHILYGTWACAHGF